MSIDVTTEKRFESDIEEFFLSPAGGYTHNQDAYDSQLGVYKDTLLRFVQKTQPKEWKHFLLQNKVDPERKFCLAFNNACDMDGLISVLRHGFKHRGIPFKVCYFKPESGLNQTAISLYKKNEITCNRQWFYSNDTHNSVDMVLAVNGIPVFALELKNQYTGQNVDHAKRQWMYDRDPREICFQFNKRILGYIAPTTPHWSTAKRAVTAFINNRDFDSKAKAASKYATAMKKDMSTGGSFQSAAAGVLGFAQKVASGGIDNALREYHREDLIGKSSEVVWTELLHEFTNYGASVEDNMAADALSQAMENLEIEDIADIGNVSVDILLKEMLKEYIKENFDFRYEEKISKGKTPAQTSAILNDMHEYIENSIDGDLNLDNLKSVDFSNMGTSQIVEDALSDALSVFEKYYGED